MKKTDSIRMVVSSGEKDKLKKEANLLNLSETNLLKLYFKIGRAISFRQSGIDIENGLIEQKKNDLITNLKGWLNGFITFIPCSSDEYKELQEILNKLKGGAR